MQFYFEDDADPYILLEFPDGMIALEFGVFGLPETFLINENGKIIFKFIKAIN